MHATVSAISISLAIAIPVSNVSAQETVKDLAAKASAELRLLNAFQTLERSTSQMNHILVYAVVAERGGWRVAAKEVGNDYVLKGTVEDLQPVISRANASIQKSKVATEDELKNADTVIASFGTLFDLAPQISELISSDEFDAAANLYKEEGHAAYESALNNAQSGVSTSQKRLGKTLLGIRIAK